METPDKDGAGHPDPAIAPVYLVGAGPGDPGLLTARALELIAVADVILYDRLIPAGALDGAGPDAELVFVGKEGGGSSVPQELTESLMIERARQGRVVVRLKGGDPFLFGRGGEEALALRGAGVPFEVVPGVTAGIAAPAYAGIPVTHRGLAGAVALVTGHARDVAGEQPEDPDWPALAAFPGTLVFYMAVGRLAHITGSLMAAGRPADEPAAIVQDGTLQGQRTIVATLASLAETARREQVGAPSIAVVGPVAALAPKLAWRRPGELSGRVGGCHAGALACQRAVDAPAGARRAGGAGAGHPHPGAPRAAARPRAVRSRLPHQPQRRRWAVRTPCGRRARRARAGRHSRGGDRGEHGTGAGRAGHRRRRDARASCRGVAR